MRALNAPELNLDLLLETIYGIQTDLQILVEQLARDRNPTLERGAALALAVVHHQLQDVQPSLRRH